MKLARHDERLFLGKRGEQGHHVLEIVALPDGGFRAGGAGDFPGVQAVTLEVVIGDAVVKVVRSIGEGGEEQDLAIAGIDRVANLAADVIDEVLELGVVLRRDFFHFHDQGADDGVVVFDGAFPRRQIEVFERDFHFAAEGDFVGGREVVVVGIEVADDGAGHRFQGSLAGFVAGDLCKHRLVGRSEFAERETEGLDGAFEALEEIDRHQCADAPLLAGEADIARDAFEVVAEGLLVIRFPAGEDELGRSVNGEFDLGELLVDGIEVMDVGAGGERRPE